MPKKNSHHTPQTIELIRTRVTEAHQRARDAVVDKPTTKPCTTCGEWKRCLPGQDFSMRRRKLADGTVNQYPAGECKSCQADRASRHREAVGREEMRKREVDYQRRYRERLRKREVLDSKPIADFLTEQLHRHGNSAVAIATGMDGSWLKRLGDQEYATVELRIVDRILVGLNCTDKLESLYPQE